MESKNKVGSDTSAAQQTKERSNDCSTGSRENSSIRAVNNDPHATGGSSVSQNSGDELPSAKTGEFNLDQFRVKDGDYAENAGGQKLLTTIPVRRPSKESWFRTHPDISFRVPARVIELKEEGEVYLVVRELWADLAGESTFTSKLLVPVLTRQKALLIWPIRLPGPDGRIDAWNSSALEAADLARTTWIRLSPNRSLGAYEVIAGPDPQAVGSWPSHNVEKLLEIAFKGKVINSLDHPVIRQLRGL